MITMHNSVKMHNAEARNVLANKVNFITTTCAGTVIVNPKWIFSALAILPPTFRLDDGDVILCLTKRSHRVHVTLDCNSQGRSIKAEGHSKTSIIRLQNLKNMNNNPTKTMK